MNDGTGHFTTRIELPHAALNRGFTRVFGVADFDVNGDGLQDLLLLHEGGRRYIQVLVNRGGAEFEDETARWMTQSATAPAPWEWGGQLQMHDVDRDGCADLVVSGSGTPIGAASPIVYRNDGRNRFGAMPPQPFTGGDGDFGWFAVPVHADGDEVVDFVVPQHHDGPDGRYGTEDDYTSLVTLLNTTPAGSIRCADPVNRPPVAAGPAGPDNGTARHVDRGRVAVVHRPRTGTR